MINELILKINTSYIDTLGERINIFSLYPGGLYTFVGKTEDGIKRSYTENGSFTEYGKNERDLVWELNGVTEILYAK